MIDFDLRLGDARLGLAELADGAVDVVISDPPFDQKTHRAAQEGPRRGNGRTAGGELPFPPLDDAQIGELAFQLARVTRRWIVLFAADRQLATWAAALELSGARVVRFGIAVRTNPKPQLTGDRPGTPGDMLVIGHADAAPMRWSGGGRAARWEAPPARFDEGGRQHPTQKSLGLLRALVRDFSEPGELVCDPFAGAGTTAVAAKELGRRFLGWELSPEYHAMAVRRVAAAHEQLTLEVRVPGEQLGFEVTR